MMCDGLFECFSFIKMFIASFQMGWNLILSGIGRIWGTNLQPSPAILYSKGSDERDKLKIIETPHLWSTKKTCPVNFFSNDRLKIGERCCFPNLVLTHPFHSRNKRLPTLTFTEKGHQRTSELVMVSFTLWDHCENICSIG